PYYPYTTLFRFRTTAAAGAADGRIARYFCGRRQRPGHLPLSRRFVRKFSTFSPEIRGVETRERLGRIPRQPDGELPLDAEHSARGHAGHRAEHRERRFSQKTAERQARGRREGSHR